MINYHIFVFFNNCFLTKILYHVGVIRKTVFIHDSKRYLTSEVSNFICIMILYMFEYQISVLFCFINKITLFLKGD